MGFRRFKKIIGKISEETHDGAVVCNFLIPIKSGKCISKFFGDLTFPIFFDEMRFVIDIELCSDEVLKVI